MARNAAGKWCIKLNRIKKVLKGWGDNVKGHTKKYKIILQSELNNIEKLEEDDILPAMMLDRKTFIQAELMRLLEEEELYWHKRANDNWLLQGDNNTNYFHKKGNGKKRKNIIFNLEKDGERIDKDEDIISHATGYYKELFGPSDSPMSSLDSECWEQEEKVIEEENATLTRKFTEEERKHVVKTMKKPQLQDQIIFQ
jgi:hypothetical protein